MTRSIKFRAWNVESEKMTVLEKVENSYDFEDGNVLSFVVDGYSDFGGHEKYNTKPSWILMQFTGLLDKNGKEIYENDYLEDWYVVWGSGKYILQNISTGDIMDCNEKNTADKEITDNRYENLREHKAMASDL